MAVSIKTQVLKRVVQQATNEYPLECCGLLWGKEEVILGLTPTRNALESPDAFSIPSEELFEFFRETRILERQFLGVYHSHPEGAASPSIKDLEEFHYHDVSYWIVGLVGTMPEVECYLWDDANFCKQNYTVL